MSPSPFLGELLGTAILVLLGDGVVAAVLLSKSKAQNSGWIVITAGWAFAVLVGVFVAIAFGSSDAHINPAVTLAFAVSSGDFSKLVTYLPAQFIGAFIGGVLVWLQYLPHWGETESQGLKLASFSTGPAISNVTTNLISEIIGTFVLVLGVAAIFSKAVGGPAAGLGPFLVAGLVWGIGLSLGGPTGYAINPARDLAPRLAHALLPIPGKGSSDWGYSWIPVVGPAIGGIIAGLLVKLIA
ncbi:MAG: MIP/aquaporin family protein [Anaerolineales bacterium]